MSPEIPLMFLLTSSNCITDSSAGVCCQNAPAPPSKTMLLAFRLLNSDPIFASAVFMLPVSGKRSAQYESLQEETNFKATRLQLWREQQEVFFFLPTQNSSGCCRANQALSVLELKYNSAVSVLNSSFGKYTFIH